MWQWPFILMTNREDYILKAISTVHWMHDLPDLAPNVPATWWSDLEVSILTTNAEFCYGSTLANTALTASSTQLLRRAYCCETGSGLNNCSKLLLRQPFHTGR